MQMQERLIVPGLGVVILLSAFILGVPLVYKLLLGLLGLGAAGTYFVPHAVQVEMRIVIAVLGLVILLLITSTAFWLTLMAFGAIAALQVQHRHILQRSPATIEWLNALLQRRSMAAREAAGGGEEAEAGDGGSAPAAAIGDLPAFVRMSVAGIGSSVLGAIVLLSLFIPWVIFLVTYDEEWEGMSYTLLAAAGTLENTLLRVLFGILLVLSLSSIASIVLPRAVAAIVALVGFLVTSFSWLYFFGEQPFVKHFFAGFVPPGVGAITVPYLGALLASFCFFVIFVLQLIPRLNKPRSKG